MTESNSIKVAIFDLGMVLIPFDINKTIQAWAYLCKCDINRVQDFFSNDTSYEAYERGEITTEQYHLNVCDALGHKMNFDDFLTGYVICMMALFQELQIY